MTGSGDQCSGKVRPTRSAASLSCRCDDLSRSFTERYECGSQPHDTAGAAPQGAEPPPQEKHGHGGHGEGGGEAEHRHDDQAGQRGPGQPGGHNRHHPAEAVVGGFRHPHHHNHHEEPTHFAHHSKVTIVVDEEGDADDPARLTSRMTRDGADGAAARPGESRAPRRPPESCWGGLLRTLFSSGGTSVGRGVPQNKHQQDDMQRQHHQRQ